MTQATRVYSTPPTNAPVDPIFDLIETHRSACTAHLAGKLDHGKAVP